MIMKNKFLRKVLSISGLVLLASFAMVSCDDDEGGKDNPILVEDGMYIVGDASPFAELSANGMMVITKNEVDQASRPGMFELYVALEAGKTFNIIEVAGKDQITYGPGEGFGLKTPASGQDQMSFDVQHGAYSQAGTFSVEENGLYQVVIDKDLGKVAILPVKYWAILGGATPLGWSDTQLPLVGQFSKTEMTFEGTKIVLREGNYKFRHSGGWKLQMDDVTIPGSESTVKVNTNFGGTLSEFVPGGADMNFAKEDEGEYTVQIKWNATSGISVTMTKTGTVDPLPEYPEAMYIVGAATAYGWDQPGTYENALMHTVAGGTMNEGLFWKICHLEGGAGFKLSAANWSEPNLGFSGVNSFDTEGVTVSDVEGNMSVAESGMYIVVLDLRNDEVKVSVKPAEVYGIGDTFGGWDAGVAANKFTVDNTAKTFTSPALVANGTIRMYTSHSWIPDWWQAEFVVVDGAIEYRNNSNNDPSVVAGTAGQIITLNFDNNTGSIQ